MLRSDLKFRPSDHTAINGTFMINNGIGEYIEIGNVTDGISVSTLVKDNPLTSCQSLYLVNLDLKQDNFLKAFKSFKSVYLTFPLTRGLETLYVTSQTLILFDGTLFKYETRWLSTYPLYELMYKAGQQLNMDISRLPSPSNLNKIQKGYLATVLMLKQKLKTSEGLEALYDLNLAWKALDELDEAFKQAPVSVHVNLINIGLLDYYNVNEFLLRALEEQSWLTLRSILKYYGKSRGNKPIFKTAMKFLSGNPDIVKSIPYDLFDKLCKCARF